MEERATVRGKPSVRPRASTPLAATLHDHRNTPRSPGRLRRHLPGYELLEELGQGGMGIVYKARQLSLDRIVALKMLRTSGRDRDDLVRFRTEAEAVGRLAHPGIVQIYEVGESDGQPFLSLEYVPGGSLDSYLGNKPLVAHHAAALVHCLARTVQHAHEQGILHRDLKPGNILLGSSLMEYGSPCEQSLAATTRYSLASTMPWRPKITDFGLAKKLDAEGTTLAGEIIGTPSYMSPEQARGDREIGPATDIWSLGAILYECLTGRPPFLGNSVFETVEQVRQQDPIPPRSLCPNVPRDLETICLKCLEKSPLRRYRSAAELAEDLQRYLEGRPIRARSISLAERAVKWARRRPTAAALVVVSLLLVLLLATAIPLHIVRLRVQIQETRLAYEQAHEAKRLADLRATCERKLAEGNEALRLGTPHDAERAMVSFATAQESISDEDADRDPELRQLRERAAALRDVASAELEKLLGTSAARSRARRVLQLRDESFYHLYPQLLGGMESAQPQQSLDACRRALECFPELDCLTPQQAEQLCTARQEVLLLLAEAMSRLDGAPARLRQALAILDRLDVADGPRHGLHLRRARYLELLGERNEAAREREAAQTTPPQTALDWFLRGQEQLLAGELRSAINEFDYALAVNPDLVWARLLRATALERTQQLTEARAELGLCIRARPSFPWPYLLRAALSLRGGQLAAATEDLDAAERLDLDESAQYALLIDRGLLALAEGRPRDAVRDFQRAILTCPSQFRAHANLAEAHWKLGELAQARSALDHALRLQPARPELLRSRCRLLCECDDLAGALRDLEQAMQKQPGVVSDLRILARLLLQMRRFSEALQASENLLAVSSTDPVGLRVRAESLLELGRHQESLTAFEAYLAKHKGDVEVYRRRARARAELGDLEGVVTDYTLALELSKEPALYLARGWARLVRGTPREAINDFSEVLRNSPRDAEALIGRGTARIEANEGRAALADLEAGLREQPNSPRVLYHAARAYARLAGQTARRDRDLDKRALAVLRQAIEATPAAERERFFREQVSRDPLFRSLRPEVEILQKQAAR